jgi:hypothetical protein
MFYGLEERYVINEAVNAVDFGSIYTSIFSLSL